MILKDNPHLEEIIIFDEHDRHKGILGKMDFIRLLKSKDFDTVYLLHRSFSRTLICRLADIPERIGHYTRKRGFLLTKKIKPPKKDSCHRIDYYLSVIEKAGLKVEDRRLDFYFSESDAAFANDFLKKNDVTSKDFLVAINAGGNWIPKRWPMDYWASLADILIGDFGAKVIITGSLSDMKLAQDIRGNMKHRPVIACGQLSIKQLAALFKRVDLFITADTGPLHIASAVGTKKIIALFGPTSVELTGPLPGENILVISKDAGCKIPCYEVHCKDNRCMKAITPKDVVEQVARIRSK